MWCLLDFLLVFYLKGKFGRGYLWTTVNIFSFLCLLKWIEWSTQHKGDWRCSSCCLTTCLGSAMNGRNVHRSVGTQMNNKIYTLILFWWFFFFYETLCERFSQCPSFLLECVQDEVLYYTFNLETSFSRTFSSTSAFWKFKKVFLLFFPRTDERAKSLL